MESKDEYFRGHYPWAFGICEKYGNIQIEDQGMGCCMLVAADNDGWLVFTKDAGLPEHSTDYECCVLVHYKGGRGVESWLDSEDFEVIAENIMPWAAVMIMAGR